jgi:hypothetical protein
MIECLLSQILKAARFAGPLVFISILAASCDSLWPSVTVNDDGLGTSIIGRFLSEKVLWNMTEEDITRGIKDILASSASRKGNVRSAVELVGMRCDNPPSTTCNYIGKAVYQLHGLPKDSPHRNKRTVVTVYLSLSSYADPSGLTVHKETLEIPTE